jgi:hypothetical protein
MEPDLFMDCRHVRAGAAPSGYVLLDRNPNLGRIVGCRVCEPCRQHIEDELLAEPILGSDKDRAP